MLLKVAIPGYQSSDEESVEFFLILMVLIFTSMTVIFLVLLFISKLSEMRRKRRKEMFTPAIDKALLGMLFEDKSIDFVSKDSEYRRLSHKRFFRELLLENALRLHASFAGDYQEKLQLFYRESGLYRISLRKLVSMRWHIRCEGVNELSRMQMKEAFPQIAKLADARNNTLKLEAMVGIIRLQGTEGLLLIAEHTGPINDWIQLNIISVVKNANYPAIPDFGRFLQSENESVVLLGIRLIATFGQVQHVPRILEIMGASTSRRILTEVKHVQQVFSPTIQTGSL